MRNSRRRLRHKSRKRRRLAKQRTRRPRKARRTRGGANNNRWFPSLSFLSYPMRALDDRKKFVDKYHEYPYSLFLDDIDDSDLQTKYKIDSTFGPRCEKVEDNIGRLRNRYIQGIVAKVKKRPNGRGEVHIRYKILPDPDRKCLTAAGKKKRINKILNKSDM